MSLNKSSPIPLYYQLSEELGQKIVQGELLPGTQLPSERELSEQYGISRMTVRQALAYLTRQGVLVAQQGLGTFVSEPKLSHDPLHLLGFTEEMLRAGAAPSSRVLEQTVASAPPPVAAGLEVAAATAVVKIVRLRLSEGIPLLLETVYVPARLCPGLEHEDLSQQSLYALMEASYGLQLHSSRQRLEAAVANAYEADVFGIPAGMGMLLLEGITYLDSGQPVETFKTIYRGDRFKVELESQRDVWPVSEANAPRLSMILRS